MSKTPSTPKVQAISTADLVFDPENPRFYRLNSSYSVETVIEEMLDDEGVQDLMASIGQKGYFQGEPLLVADDGGQLVVVEGNRRLAAVKLLNGELQPPSRRQTSIAQLRQDAAVVPPTALPCIVYPTRREVKRYLGYRHITGIKEWDALSKAKYLQDIRQEFYPNLPHEEQMVALAKDIGSRRDYVGQLLTALGLYIHAEDARFFDLPMSAKDVEFSYLTTALNYSKITSWLGLTGRVDIDMPGLKGDNLKRVFGWLFPKNQQGYTIIGESRNLNQLADIVSSEEAVKILEETGRLSEAFMYSEGPQLALVKALGEAQERVQTAWNMLPKTQPLTNQHLDMAEKLSEDARSIRSYLRERLED